MPQEDIIAKRYARSLAEYAFEAGVIGEVGEDLGRLADLVDPRGGGGVPDFMNFLLSPALAPKAKRDAAAAILGKMGVGRTASDFLNVLIGSNRVALLPRINRMFAFLAATMANERAAIIHAARPLSAGQSSRLAAALEKTLGTKVRLTVLIEPGLLAGARIELDGNIVDGTVVGRLESLKRKLTVI